MWFLGGECSAYVLSANNNGTAVLKQRYTLWNKTSRSLTWLCSEIQIIINSAVVWICELMCMKEYLAHSNSSVLTRYDLLHYSMPYTLPTSLIWISSLQWPGNVTGWESPISCDIFWCKQKNGLLLRKGLHLQNSFKILCQTLQVILTHEVWDVKKTLARLFLWGL